MFFFRFKYSMIYVLYPHVAYLLTLSRNMVLMKTSNLDFQSFVILTGFTTES
jgi:hypothetical protein